MIKSDIELGIKSPDYYAAAFTSKVQQEAYIKKFESQQVGPRKINRKSNKVLNIGPKLVSPEKTIKEIPIRLKRESIGSIQTMGEREADTKNNQILDSNVNLPTVSGMDANIHPFGAVTPNNDNGRLTSMGFIDE